MTDRSSCPYCSESILKTAKVCPHCRKDVLFDVVLTKPIEDDRKAYLAAKTLSSCPEASIGFEVIKQRIDNAPGVIFASHTAAGAEELTWRMVSQGVLAGEIRPAQPDQTAVTGPTGSKAGGRKGVPMSWWIIGGVAVLLCLLVLFKTSGFRSDGAAEEPRLATQTIADRAISSTVHMRCGDQLGTGFFVEPDLVVTNAHVLCGSSKTLEVVFESGLVAQGKTIEKNTWLDYALVRIDGADAPPIEIGDATTLIRGDSVFFAGSPQGLDYTFSQGIVSHPSRVIRGVSFLQVDAAVNPGNSGGALLNQNGQVVGLVTAMVGEGSNLGLVLPINYLSGSSKLRTTDGFAELDNSDWDARLDDARVQNQKEVETFRARRGEIRLADFWFTNHGTTEAVVVQWNEARPGPTRLDFELVFEDRPVCRPSGYIQHWERLNPKTTLKDFDPRFVTWLKKNKLFSSLYVGGAQLRMNGCPDPVTVMSSELVLKSYDE